MVGKTTRYVYNYTKRQEKLLDEIEILKKQLAMQVGLYWADHYVDRAFRIGVDLGLSAGMGESAGTQKKKGKIDT